MTVQEQTVDNAHAVPTGNHTDKYELSNPIARRMVENFIKNLDEVLGATKPQSLIDVGCGEGVLTRKWADELLKDGRIVGVDLKDAQLEAEWKNNPCPENLQFKAALAGQLPFAENEFQVATAIEVLEHVPDPQQMLSDMCRVASNWIVASVPREPIWRMVNVARGSYVTDFGNTPGHINHWSKRSFISMLSRYGTITEVRTPFPWTMALVQLNS